MSDIAANLAKAKEEEAEGDSSTKGSIFQRLTNDQVRFGEAAEHYNRAGNYYRLAKQRTSSFSFPSPSAKPTFLLVSHCLSSNSPFYHVAVPHFLPSLTFRSPFSSGFGWKSFQQGC